MSIIDSTSVISENLNLFDGTKVIESTVGSVTQRVIGTSSKILNHEEIENIAENVTRRVVDTTSKILDYGDETKMFNLIRPSELKKMVMNAVNNDSTLIGKLFAFLESKLNVRRGYILAGMVAFLALYLVVGYGAQFLSNLIGFIYPAYASIRAIESPETGDDTKWLTYWVVFALFATFEYPIEFILRWIPFYFLFKCAFFAWLFMPVLNGSNTVYKVIIRPFFLGMDKDLSNSVVAGVAKVSAWIMKFILSSGFSMGGNIVGGLASNVADTMNPLNMLKKR